MHRSLKKTFRNRKISFISLRVEDGLSSSIHWPYFRPRQHHHQPVILTSIMALRIAVTKSLHTVGASRAAFSTVGALDRMQTQENYDAVLKKFAEIRACAVLRTATSEACPLAMQAAVDGGFKICEFTLTTPNALEHVADFRKRYDGDVMIGCGTILTIEDAENAIDAGCKSQQYL